jgi:hypothetical protein
MTQRYASKRSLKNTTETPLSADATWTGAWEDCSSYDSIAFAVKADVTGTLCAQFTSKPEDDTIDSSLDYKISANINEVYRLTITRQFFRLVYTNDSTEQTSMSLDCMLGSHPLLTAPLNLNVGLDSDAIVTRPSNFADEVIIGRRPGIRNFTKFGYASGLTAAAGEETVWAATGNFTPMTTASTFTITFNNATDGLGTTGALSLFIDYIDENGLSAQTQLTLDATGSQVTSFSGFGINRAAVVNSGSAQTNTNNITITETTGATIQALIPASEGVTQQCIFHTDANSDAVARYLWINANKLSGGGSPRITIKGYVFNRTYETRFEVFRCTIDTSSESFVSLSEPNGFVLSPRDVLYFVADTDTNNSIVNLRFSLMEYKRD